MSPRPERVRTPRFVQLRHKLPSPLLRPRELVVACAPMRSHVNLSQIARTASASGVRRMVVCGNARLINKIAREPSDDFELETRRTLAPVLDRLTADGFRIVGLEQATNATSLHAHTFDRRTVLVVGNERKGLLPELLERVHDVVEIPVWGLPHSYNAATAANMAIYEYCRQFPRG